MSRGSGNWLTVSEASSALSVSIDTVRRMIRRKTIGAEKIASRHGPTWLVWVETDPTKELATPNTLEDRVAYLETENYWLKLRLARLEGLQRRVVALERKAESSAQS